VVAVAIMNHWSGVERDPGRVDAPSRPIHRDSVLARDLDAERGWPLAFLALVAVSHVANESRDGR
jgi:hypothetical protein